MKKSILLTLFVLILSVAVFAQQKDYEKLYWSADKLKCPICDSITIQDTDFDIFDGEKFHLALASNYTDKLIQVAVYLENKTDGDRIEFKPTDSVMVLFVKKGEPPTIYQPMSPEQVAKKIGGQPKLKNFLTLFAAGMARQNTTVNSTTSGSVYATGTNGSASGTYNESGSAVISSPDRAAQTRAQQTVADRNAKAQNTADSVLSSALRANTIFPKKYIAGNLYFERKKGELMFIGIMVSGVMYVRAYNLPAK